MFHIKKDGAVGQCRASVRGCPFGGQGAHFESAEQAQAVVDALNEHGLSTEDFSDTMLGNLRDCWIAGGDVSSLIGEGYSSDQLTEIKLGLESGVDVSKFANANLDWGQMREIRLGLESGVDVSDCVDEGFTPEQIRRVWQDRAEDSSYVSRVEDFSFEYDKYFARVAPERVERIKASLEKYLGAEVREGSKSGSERELAVKRGIEKLFEGYGRKQLETINAGLAQGLPMLDHVSPDFSDGQVREVFFGLKQGLDVSSYARADVSKDEMRVERIRLARERDGGS